MSHFGSGGLDPYQIRTATFGTCWRGVDPSEVAAFLGRIAKEMDLLLRELATARTENRRMREGLRQWQHRHVGCRFVDPDWSRQQHDRYDTGRSLDRPPNRLPPQERQAGTPTGNVLPGEALPGDEPGGRRNGGHW